MQASPRLISGVRGSSNNGPRTSSALKTLFLFVVLPAVCLGEALYLANNETRSGYEQLYLLPMCYMVAVLLANPLIASAGKWRKGGIYYLAQGVLAFRYLILPLAVNYTHIHGGWTYYGTDGFGIEPVADSVRMAIVLMCTEVFFAELAFFFAYKYVLPKISEKRKKRANNTRSTLVHESEISVLGNAGVLVFFILGAFVLLALFQRQLIFPKEFFVIGDSYDSEASGASGSFWQVIFTAFRLAVLVLVYSASGKRYMETRKKIWIVPPALALLVYLGFSAGISRWALLIPVIASVFLFYRMFKPFPKLVIAAIVIVMCIGIYSTTYYKYGYLVKGSDNEALNLLGLTLQQSNEYVSGPRSIAQGVETLAAYGDRLSITSFFNSFLSGFAGLSSLTNDADKLQSFFNYYCLGSMIDRPLICPTIIEGIAFVPFFPWFFICLFEVLAVVCDDISLRENRIEWVFLWSVMGCWFSLCLAVNTKIIVSQCSCILIPCALLFFVNERLAINNRRK